MQVTILGPNLEMKQATDAADAVYGPSAGGFYQESGGDKAHGSLQNYLSECLTDFYFAPCLPAQNIAPKEATPMTKTAKKAQEQIAAERETKLAAARAEI